MKTTILNMIMTPILGRKYYANIVFTRGQAGIQELASFIFPTQEEATLRVKKYRTPQGQTYFAFIPPIKT